MGRGIFSSTQKQFIKEKILERKSGGAVVASFGVPIVPRAFKFRYKYLKKLGEII